MGPSSLPSNYCLGGERFVPFIKGMSFYRPRVAKLHTHQPGDGRAVNSCPRLLSSSLDFLDCVLRVGPLTSHVTGTSAAAHSVFIFESRKQFPLSLFQGLGSL